MLLQLVPDIAMKYIVLHLNENELRNLQKVINNYYITQRIKMYDEINKSYRYEIFINIIKNKLSNDLDDYILGMYLNSGRWYSHLIDKYSLLIDNIEKLHILIDIVPTKSQNIIINSFKKYLESSD